MINKLLNLFPFMVVAILATIVIGQLTDARAELSQSKHDYVFTVCEQSRTTVSGASERECADAQYKAKVEYLCAERNASPYNYCWTEDNDKLENY